MKYLFLALLTLFVIQVDVDAQILDRAKYKAKQRKTQKENQAIDKGLDAVEGIFKKKKKNMDQPQNDSPTNDTNGSQETNTDGGADRVREGMPRAEEIQVWTKRYDFKPGKDIIFYDDFEDEETGEIPSKWKYNKGIMEVVEVDNEYSYVMSGDLGYGHPNWKEGHSLPDRFTIEFDVFMADPADNGGNSYGYAIYLYKPDGGKAGAIGLGHGTMTLRNKVEGVVPGTTRKDYYNTWNHISISVNKNSIKGYFNDFRMFNSRLEDGITISNFTLWNCCLEKTSPHVFLIDNFKVAEGAHPKYKEEILEGKIVTNNIHFAYNSAEIIPRSYAEIKRVAKVMESNPDMTFSIEGHTDSDGKEEYNLSLSEKRANSVLEALVEMGIARDRLSAKGLGESQPLVANGSPEGKATNRRVEFIAL